MGNEDAKTIDELRRTQATLEEETRLLDALNRTGALLASQLDLESIVQAVTDSATSLTGANFGAFFYTVPNPEGGVFTLYTLSGAPRAAFDKFGHPRATPLFGPTFEGQPGVIRIADVRKDPRYGQWPPYHGMPPGHLPVCSYLAIPVALRSGEIVGGLFFGHRSPDMFTERHERIVEGIASQAAVAFDNARLFAETKRAVEAERAARTEVERVSTMKDEFLATLSHELRTPLNAVLGWAEMLRLRAGDDAELARGLDTIVRNARAQTQMIEDLLDMNRIVSGKIRLDVQKLDLAAVVDAAIDSVRPSLDARQLTLNRMLDPLVGPMFGDPHRLQQVVWNLLSNAVKFTPRGGRVDVMLHRVESHVEIVVSDSGSGIDAEFVPYVFDRFRQADSSTTRRYGGLGLGLSIVRQLVEMHGGTVRAHSPGKDKGATFVVALPLRVVHEPDERGHPGAPAAKVPDLAISLAGLKVLLVDDEPDARELLSHVLSSSEAEVTAACTADEAFALVATVRPDVIVSDIGMPDKDGYQLMREIRSLPVDRGGRTPAIALTAFARSEDRTRALISGFQVHIAKPIEPRELVVTIASLTGRTGGPG